MIISKPLLPYSYFRIIGLQSWHLVTKSSYEEKNKVHVNNEPYDILLINHRVDNAFDRTLSDSPREH
jgi:vacuolar-type H+-ATPase subunit F/Vma7